MLPPGWVEFFAGTAGGIASVVVGHPFDTVKTRLQAQAPVGPAQPLLPGVPLLAIHYTGTLNAFGRIVREERVVGLYKGVLSPMTFLAGVASGIGSALITSPMELFKIQQQINTSATQRTTYMQAIAGVWRAGGLRAFFHGFGATCVRDVGYGPYFFTYALLNRWMLLGHSETRPELSNAEMAVSGALAGVVGWLATYWADVVKTRIQAEPISSFRNHTPGFWPVLRATYRQGGLGALFAGASTTVLRAIPANAALFVVYEAVKRELST
ncbi:hypothetical protein CBS14141_003932 [Malassezia furfur]|nr:hypothetical protein CBS14141_003932 [Malassezia furfur]